MEKLNMELAGYKEWTRMFNEGISKIWKSERKELQKAGMLFGALEQELQSNKTQFSLFSLFLQLLIVDVRNIIEGNLSTLRQQFQEKDSVIHKKLSSS